MTASWSGPGWAVRSLSSSAECITLEARLTDPTTLASLRIILSNGRIRMGVLEMSPDVVQEPRDAWSSYSLPLSAMHPL